MTSSTRPGDRSERDTEPRPAERRLSTIELASRSVGRGLLVVVGVLVLSCLLVLVASLGPVEILLINAIAWAAGVVVGIRRWRRG